MALAHQPSGLMDIASSLSQDEIPFKLRCAICNKLAVNAFRLPCCDQAICENCQTSLPGTCPVCAHTPISPDLCKPNKALRTTLKAFLRTEEKKREKERERVLPTAQVDPISTNTLPKDAPQSADVPKENHVVGEVPPSTLDGQLVQPPIKPPAEVATESTIDGQTNSVCEPQAKGEEVGNNVLVHENTDMVEHGHGGDDGDGDGDGADADAGEFDIHQGDIQQVMTQPIVPGQMPSNPMAMGMMGGYMGWNAGANFNPMSQLMVNGMLNFQNPMGIPGMAMDPMAQGMFGGYGMNMNGMNSGMNMGMGFDAGQGMYGDWDGSQNNMWNGGQDKFNPNAFANGMGQQYGGRPGFSGLNMSQPQQFPNHSSQDSHYGSGYTRGNFRGHGRGFTYGRGRGSFVNQPHVNSFSDTNKPVLQDQDKCNPELQSQLRNKSIDGLEGEVMLKDKRENGLDAEQEKDKGTKEDTATDVEPGDMTGEAKPANDKPTDISERQTLRGIPTIGSLDHAGVPGFTRTGPAAATGYSMGAGFGRGGYMRGGFVGGRGGSGTYIQGSSAHAGPRVEGAPAAPRAMREGLPNTSVFRQRGYQQHMQWPANAGKPAAALKAVATGVQEPAVLLSGSRSRSQSKIRSRSPSRARSRSRSRSRADSSRRHHRYRSRSYDPSDDDRDRRRERRRRSRRDEKHNDRSEDEYDRRTRSPSVESSMKSSRRRDRERDRHSGRRSHRSRRHYTRSPSRSGDTRDRDRLSAVPEEDEVSSQNAAEPSRSSRSRKDSRKYDDARDRDRGRGRDRDRDRDRETRRREREHNHDHDPHDNRDRNHDHDRSRERVKKRSRRSRTESPGGESDHTSRHRSRRSKRYREEDYEKISTAAATATTTVHLLAPVGEPEKDPHTLEREARNRERLAKEQQRRDAINGERSRRKRDSRAERIGLLGNRRVSYKYEDDESDSARAERVESEREASRWA